MLHHQIFILIMLFYCKIIFCMKQDFITNLLENDIIDLYTLRNSNGLSINCTKQIDTYQNELLELKPWAIQMFDASSKLHSGYWSGNILDLGSFDQCLAINENEIRGQYCLILLIANQLLIKRLPTKYDNFTKIPLKILARLQEQLSRFESIPGAEYITKLTPLVFSTCIPDQCRYNDLNKHIQTKIGPLFIALTHKIFCTSEINRLQLTTWNWVVISCLGVYVLAVISITVYFAIGGKKCKNMSCFSLVDNFKQLVDTKRKPGTIQCLNGIRVLSVVWIIFGHRASFNHFGLSTNLFDVWKMEENIFAQIILSARVAVDTFFLLSGCLIMVGHLASKKSLNIPLMYLLRFFRLTPSIAILLLIEIFILPYLSSGPLWKAYNHLDPCNKYWWYTLLYIINFGDREKCLPHLWYLSTDTQLFLFSPLLIIAAFKLKKKFLYIVGILTFVSIIVNGEYAWRHQLWIQSHWGDWIDKSYIRIEYRAGSWLVGIGLGFVLHHCKNHIIRIKRIWLYLLWSLTLFIGLIIIFVGHIVSQPGYVYEPWFNSLYISVHRPLWALVVAWIIFACVHNFAPIINSLLSWRFFHVLSKLSFSMYLLHLPLQTYLIVDRRQVEHITHLKHIYNTVADFHLTLAFSIPWTLLFEMPIQAIVSKMLKTQPQQMSSHIGNIQPSAEEFYTTKL